MYGTTSDSSEPLAPAPEPEAPRSIADGPDEPEDQHLLYFQLACCCQFALGLCLCANEYWFAHLILIAGAGIGLYAQHRSSREHLVAYGVFCVVAVVQDLCFLPVWVDKGDAGTEWRDFTVVLLMAQVLAATPLGLWAGYHLHGKVDESAAYLRI